MFAGVGRLLSYGPCQFPTMGFVIDRYLAVENFVEETFWHIDLTHVKDGKEAKFRWSRRRLFDGLAAGVEFVRLRRFDPQFAGDGNGRALAVPEGCGRQLRALHPHRGETGIEDRVGRRVGGGERNGLIGGQTVGEAVGPRNPLPLGPRIERRIREIDIGVAVGRVDRATLEKIAERDDVTHVVYVDTGYDDEHY